MARTPYGAILVDAGFCGILPFLLGDRPGSAAGARLRHDAAHGKKPRHRSERHGPATVVDPAGAVRDGALNALSQKVLLRSRRTTRIICLTGWVAAGCRSSSRFGLFADRYFSPNVRNSTIRAAICLPMSLLGAVHPTPSERFGLPRGGRSSPMIARSCMSPRARSTTPIWVGCWSRRSRR